MSVVKSCKVLKVSLVPSLDAGAAARSLVEMGPKRLEVYETVALAQGIVERAVGSLP
jgi:hypothetical protein